MIFLRLQYIRDPVLIGSRFYFQTSIFLCLRLYCLFIDFMI
ncbi:hypothetical protein HMPREF0765_3331 [Sphingobacterium spiritivorum ATCC 33300]|uniref:Uncharacterized protein n=1 Tax=Sphingobacterium spiritivorum ATCC 33300 TaxID=525372 RepID=C2G175_SPHSI|nr:hypothetical protein HMPREF0765_3331 [Sphingobacterium spiritivorum ATCC 33300]